MEPQVSIVVITRDRAEALRRILPRLLATGAPVIVVDNDSADDTPAVLGEHRVQAIRLAENLGAAGRNVGVARAATPYVAFSDDDSWWASGAFSRAVAHFQRHPRLGLIAARVLVGPEQHVDPTCEAMGASVLGRAADLPGPSVLGFIACGAVARRDAFLAAGGFHPRYEVGGEERLLALDLARHGWALAYCEDVLAHHHPEAHGERPARRARMVRNDLWTAWLRGRPGHAAVFTWKTLLKGTSDRATRAGLAAALRGMPWVIGERSAIGAALQAQLARVS